MSQGVANPSVLASWRSNFYVVELYPSANNRSSNKVTVYVTPLNQNRFSLQNVSAPFLLPDVDINVLRKCQRILETFFNPAVKLNDSRYPQAVSFEYRAFYNHLKNLPVFEIRDPRALSLPAEPPIPDVVKVYLNTKDPRIQKACLDRLDAFVANPFEKASQLEEACRSLPLLCLIEHEYITREVFRRFLGRINDYLLEPIFVAGLADAIDRARPDHLIPEHLAEILDVIAGKIGPYSTLSEKTLLELLNALARIANAITDAKGQIRFDKKEEIKKTLEQIKSSSSIAIKISAVYAQEAISRVVDTESLFAKVFRISAGLVKGTWCLYAAFNRMDPKYALDGFLALQQGAERFIEDFAKPFAEQAKEVVGTVQSIAGNVSDARELVDRLRGKLGWFEQLRYIEWLIASNCFRYLERFLCDSSLKKNEDFLFLVVSKLHRVILTHPHRQIRSETIKLFAHLYYADIFWLNDVKGDFSLKLLNTSPRLATKAMIVSCLQFYQTSEELRAAATTALDLITGSANSNPAEIQFLQSMRRKPLALASYTSLIAATDQSLIPAVPMLPELPPSAASALPKEPYYLPSPSSPYLLPAAETSPAASPIPARLSNAGSFSPPANNSIGSAPGSYTSFKLSETYTSSSPSITNPIKPPAQSLPVTTVSSAIEEDFRKGDKFAVEGNFDEAVIWYRKAAEQGHADAQNSLGVCYFDGKGVASNLKEAAIWFRMAADQGHAAAQYNLGLCYFDGKGVASNLKEAAIWFRMAADQGYADAQNSLGVCYFDGEGVIKDPKEAAIWYRKAADQSYAAAQYNLGVCYFDGEGVAQDLKEAAIWYRKAAVQGHAAAQCRLGFCYKDGKGVIKDLKEAAIWFRMAADHGLSHGEFQLGRCYENGKGVIKDLKEAAIWFRMAADHGHAAAQYNLGLCYFDGKGVIKDLKEAAIWFRKAADQGNANAQLSLAGCYFHGEGVAQDLKKSVSWVRKAADQGHARAQFYLGLSYYDGRGVDQNLKEASSWFRKAADQDHADAQYFLGICYETDKDVQEAILWYQKAANQGHARASQQLSILQ